MRLAHDTGVLMKSDLGRLIRDIGRKLEGDEELQEVFAPALSKALPGNPYGGHTSKDVIEQTEALTGREIDRAYVDKGYRGHDAAKPGRVFRSGQNHRRHRGRDKHSVIAQTRFFTADELRSPIRKAS